MNHGLTTIPNGTAADPREWIISDARRPELGRRAAPPDREALRRCAWEIGERRAADHYASPTLHVGLALVTPTQGYLHWQILPGWVDEARDRLAHRWDRCRMIVRLYDVSYIHFNGLNAHRIQDHPLPALAGHLFFSVPASGIWQIAEVGFLLLDGEFVPAARSRVVQFPRESASPHGEHTALLVNEDGTVEEVGNVWDQEQILAERNTPRLRGPLRIAAFAFESLVSGHDTPLARFVSEIASAQAKLGHEIHVFTPGGFAEGTRREGATYHPLPLTPTGSCLDDARAFARVAEEALASSPSFDLIHLHEWMTGYGDWFGTRPAVVSFGSLEVTRLGDTPPTALSVEVQQIERELAQKAECVLVPHGLWTRAVEELTPDVNRVHGFSMEGRPPDEWETPLDQGHVKMEVGIGPLDRMILYIGPIEHAAGVDLLIEALPVVLQRMGNVRVAFIGTGPVAGLLDHRAHQLGVAHAVRQLGHVEGPHLSRLLRSAEAVVLPSRYRVPFDDAVVDLARRAGKPVVTTHSGPAHLIRHEENGIITYDNPGSMVWALDRILGDPAHAERMGQNGRRHESAAPSWDEAAHHFFDLCVRCFPELTFKRGR